MLLHMRAETKARAKKIKNGSTKQITTFYNLVLLLTKNIRIKLTVYLPNSKQYTCRSFQKGGGGAPLTSLILLTCYMQITNL